MTLSPTAAEALCITGDPRSGKTGALVERAAAWAEAAPAISVLLRISCDD